MWYNIIFVDIYLIFVHVMGSLWICNKYAGSKSTYVILFSLDVFYSNPRTFFQALAHRVSDHSLQIIKLLFALDDISM